MYKIFSFISLFVFILTSCTDTNVSAQNLADINQLYENNINKSYESIDYENRATVLNSIQTQLLSFFNSKASLTTDISKSLPFIHVGISDDNRLKVFSYDTVTGGSLEEVNCILQYIPSTGNPYAISISELLSPNDFGAGAFYSSIYPLDNNVYLLVGSFNGDGRTRVTKYFTIKVENNRIMSYQAFNGKSLLSEEEDRFAREEGNEKFKLFQQLPYVIDIAVNSQSRIREPTVNNSTYYIELRQTGCLFYFDGEKYVGDYNRLE